jgi:F0F1-type ATP synthase assembly protein I
MNLRDQRVQKTSQVMMLVIFGFSLGSLEAQPILDTRHWVLLVVYLIGIGCGTFMLLRDVWAKAEH